MEIAMLVLSIISTIITLGIGIIAIIMAIIIGIIVFIQNKVKVQLNIDNPVYQTARYIRSKAVPNIIQEQIDREYIAYSFDIVNKGNVGCTINSMLFDSKSVTYNPVPPEWLNLKFPLDLSPQGRTSIEITIRGNQGKVWENRIYGFILPLANEIYIPTNTFRKETVIWT